MAIQLDSFDIYFSGKLVPGNDQAVVQQKLQALFKLQAKTAERLFSGTPIRVKSAVSVEAANRYRAAFRTAGALIEILVHDPESSQAASLETLGQADADQQTTPTSPPLSALPANTGSLEDCHPPVPQTPIPDISWIQVAPLGELVDNTPPASPPMINISGLSAAPPHDGSLEDCVTRRPSRPIPDISRLRIVAPED